MSIPTGPVSSWTSAQIAGLSVADLASLTQSPLNVPLTVEQTNAFANVALSNFTFFTSAQWNNLFKLVPSLPATLFPQMNANQVNAFNWNTVGNYTYLQYLTAKQVGNLLTAQGPGVLTGSWYSGQSNFNVATLAYGLVQQNSSWWSRISSAQWNNLFKLVPSLPATLFPQMNTNQVNAFDWHAVGNYIYLPYLTASQVGNLLTVQGPGVLTGSWYSGESNFNVTALAAGLVQQSSSWWVRLSADQWTNLFNLIPQLSATLIPLMNAGQVNAFDWHGVGNYVYLKYLTANQVGNLLAVKGPGVLTGSWYSGESNFNVTALATGLIQQDSSWWPRLSVVQWNNLFKLIPQLPAALVPQMYSNFINEFDWGAVGNYTYLQYLTANQISALIKAQGPGVLTGSRFSTGTNFNITALASGLIQLSLSWFSGVSASVPWSNLFASVPRLPAALIPLMSTEQVNAFDWHAIGNYVYMQYLTENQVSTLQISSLSTGAIASLTSTAVSALTLTQVSALTTAQVHALGANAAGLSANDTSVLGSKITSLTPTALGSIRNLSANASNITIADPFIGGVINDLGSNNTLNASQEMINLTISNTTLIVNGASNTVNVKSTGDSVTVSNQSNVIGIGEAAATTWFVKSGSNLLISGYAGNTFTLDLVNWFNTPTNTIKASNGLSINATGVQALVSAMAAFSPPISSQTSLPIAEQQKLTPLIATNWK